MTEEKKHYSIIGISINEKGKAKCGDFFLYRELEDERIIILTLSDGVGSRHHDYVASHTACSVFVDSFIDDKSLGLPLRFKTAIQKADKAVSEPENPSHKGMMCTFVGVVWDTTKNYILYESIGDSRLYKHSPTGVYQISTDSKKAVLMRDKSGKLLKQSGVLIIREGLTNALGYNGATIDIKKMDFMPGESFILCTDGMYSISEFDTLLEESLHRPELKKSMEKFINKGQELFDDDASMVVMQRNDQPINYKELYYNIIQQFSDFRQNNIMAHLLSDFIQNEILSQIEIQDADTIKKYSLYIEKYNILLSEEFVENAILSMKNKNFIVVEFYKLLIQRLKVLKW